MSRFRTLQKTVSKSKHYLIDLQYIKCIFAQYLSKFSETYFEHPTFQGATAPTWGDPGCRFACPGLSAPLAFIDIIGCGSAIQASLIAFALHDDSARTCK